MCKVDERINMPWDDTKTIAFRLQEITKNEKSHTQPLQTNNSEKKTPRPVTPVNQVHLPIVVTPSLYVPKEKDDKRSLTYEITFGYVIVVVSKNKIPPLLVFQLILLRLFPLSSQCQMILRPISIH
jgi:hypothetical protein